MSSALSRPVRPDRARLKLARRRAQPGAVFIARLVIPAMLAYLLAQALLPAPAPLLAPLTALLVVQVSLYRTMRSAAQRVISVTAGVIVAVVLVGLLGFSWWSLGVAIAAALLIGLVLRLGDHILEVPISAMLILQLGTETAAADRVVETLIGAGVGLVASLIASPVRVQPAEEAITDLSRSMATLLDQMADGLREPPGERAVTSWLERSRELGAEIQRVDSALAEAEESARLNPRARSVPGPAPALRSALETLEYATVTVRGLSRCVADRTQLHIHDSDVLGAQMWDADVRDRLAMVLRDIASATRLYGQAATASSVDEAIRLVAELEGRLARGRERRDDLGRLLREDPGHWPLHGELLVHLDRLLDGLRAGKGHVTRRHHRRRSAVRPVPRRLVRTRRTGRSALESAQTRLL
jgi:aromatic acid exporter family member 1